MKAASSDSSDSNWSVVDNNPDNILVSSFISSAILAVHDPSPRPPRLPQATQALPMPKLTPNLLLDDFSKWGLVVKAGSRGTNLQMGKSPKA